MSDEETRDTPEKTPDSVEKRIERSIKALLTPPADAKLTDVQKLAYYRNRINNSIIKPGIDKALDEYLVENGAKVNGIVDPKLGPELELKFYSEDPEKEGPFKQKVNELSDLALKGYNERNSMKLNPKALTEAVGTGVKNTFGSLFGGGGVGIIESILGGIQSMLSDFIMRIPALEKAKTVLTDILEGKHKDLELTDFSARWKRAGVECEHKRAALGVATALDKVGSGTAVQGFMEMVMHDAPAMEGCISKTKPSNPGIIKQTLNELAKGGDEKAKALLAALSTSNPHISGQNLQLIELPEGAGYAVINNTTSTVISPNTVGQLEAAMLPKGFKLDENGKGVIVLDKEEQKAGAPEESKKKESKKPVNPLECAKIVSGVLKDKDSILESIDKAMLKAEAEGGKAYDSLLTLQNRASVDGFIYNSCVLIQKKDGSFALVAGELEKGPNGVVYRPSQIKEMDGAFTNFDTKNGTPQPLELLNLKDAKDALGQFGALFPAELTTLLAPLATAMGRSATKSNAK